MKKLLDYSGLVEKKILSVLAIMFVGLLLGGVGGCFISLSVMDSDNVKSSVKNKMYQKVDADVNLVKTIDELYFIDYLNRSIYDSSEITNMEALELVWRNLRTNDAFTLESAQNEANKHFNVRVKGEDIYLRGNGFMNDTVPVMKYDEANGFTTNTEYPASDLFQMEIVNIIDEVTKLDNSYKVVVYKAYGDFSGNFTNVYYGNMNDSINEMNEILRLEFTEDENTNLKDFVAEEIAKVDKSKLTKVTYMFDKVEDRYIFNSFVIE